MVELTQNQRSLVGYMKRSDQHASHGFDLILKSKQPEHYFEELRSQDFFSAENNPLPQPVQGKDGYFRVPFWAALKYLTRTAAIAGESANINLGNRLMEVVREIAQPPADGTLVDNYHTFAALTEVMASVPTACVTLEDVDLIQTFLSSKWDNSLVAAKVSRMLSTLLSGDAPDDSAKAVRLLWHVTALKPDSDNESSGNREKTLVEPFWLDRALRENVNSIGVHGGVDAIRCLLERNRQIFSGDYLADRTWLRRPAIEDHEQNYDWDQATNSLVDSARDALQAWLSAKVSDARGLIRDMLANGSQIDRRIAINAIRVNWEELSEVFIQQLGPALFDIGHIHEMYLLLKERYRQLDARSRQAVLEVIFNLTPDEGADETEVRISQSRQRNWLHAIKGQGDASADAEYGKIVAAVGPPDEHPDLLSYHFSGWVGPEKSAYTTAELTAFADDRSLITRVEAIEVPASDPHASRKGLIDELAKAVQSAPDRFLWTLEPQIEVRRDTQYGLIQGFAKAIEEWSSESNAASIDDILAALLPYLRSITKDKGFWEERAVSTGRFEPDKDWIPLVASAVLKKIASSDDIPLTAKSLSYVTDTLRDIRDFAPSISLSSDPMTSAINNARGISIEALLQLTLRICRFADRENGDHEAEWAAIKPDIDTELAGCTDGKRLETSTLMACYLAQMMYVDRSWTEENVHRIFPTHSSDNFTSAIAGLSFANVSQPVYELLRDADVPRIALSRSDVSGSSRERLIERIALAYAWGQENLASPVLLEMRTDDRIDDLIELTSTIARWSNEQLNPQQMTSIRDFARLVVNFGLEREDARRKLLSASSRLIAFAEEPYGNDLPWLLGVARFASIGFGGDKFIEALDAIADKDAKTAQMLLDAYFQGYSLDHDYRNHLKSTIGKIYASGLQTEAISLLDRVVKLGGGPEWVDLYRKLRDGETAVAPTVQVQP